MPQEWNGDPGGLVQITGHCQVTINALILCNITLTSLDSGRDFALMLGDQGRVVSRAGSGAMSTRIMERWSEIMGEREVSMGRVTDRRMDEATRTDHNSKTTSPHSKCHTCQNMEKV